MKTSALAIATLVEETGNEQKRDRGCSGSGDQPSRRPFFEERPALTSCRFCRNVVSSGTKMADEVLDRESEVFMAKLTEQAERYEGR